MIKIRNVWYTLTIRKKIGIFTGVVFLIILVAVLFSVWTFRFALTDFNQILKEDDAVSAYTKAMGVEARAFEEYTRNPNLETKEILRIAAEETEIQIDELPYSYMEMNEDRYIVTRSIINSYATYQIERDIFTQNYQEGIKAANLQEIYTMQSYLNEYGSRLMEYTLRDGSETYQEQLKFMQIVPIVIISIGLLLVVGIIKLSEMMNSAVINPVMKLVGASKKIAANDFFIDDVEVKSQDELGELVRAFNKMKYATGEYILGQEEKQKTQELLYAEELEKLALENQLDAMKMEVLKNQINPHFLFNTLNVIGGMANLEDAQTTETMIKALSTLFRYNLKTTETEVPLIKELYVTKQYMYLQSMRFGNRISYNVKCNVNEETTIVPTFVLQPLVENAILHGISKREEGGSIKIEITSKEDILMIEIIDDGIGMSEEKLTQLDKKLREKQKDNSGIGLGNVYRRIHTMYKKSKFCIHSQEGEGTTIEIEIPLKEVS
ncbi:MAG: sensor histidine kinase [Suipraeoptans sp.]